MGPSRHFKFLQGYQNSGKARRAVGTAVGTRRHLKKGAEFLLQSQSRGQGDELTRELRALSIWAGGAENAPSAFLCQFDEGAGQGRPHPLGNGFLSVTEPCCIGFSRKGAERDTPSPKSTPKKKPTQLLMLSPAGAALGAKKKKSEEKGFFSLCIIAVQPHLFLQYAWHQAPVTAIPTPSSASAPPHDTGAAAARAADGFRRCSPS